MALREESDGRQRGNDQPEPGASDLNRPLPEVFLHERHVDDAADADKANAGALDAEEGDEKVREGAREQVQRA